MVDNRDLGLSFDFRDEMPMSFNSSRLEGVWWRPDGDSRYDLVVSNMEENEVIASVRASGDQLQIEQSSFDVQLAPHQTRIISIDDEWFPFTTTEGAGKVGGMGQAQTRRW